MEEVSPVASVSQAEGFAASGIPAPPMCAPGYAWEDEPGSGTVWAQLKAACSRSWVPSVPAQMARGPRARLAANHAATTIDQNAATSTSGETACAEESAWPLPARLTHTNAKRRARTARTRLSVWLTVGHGDREGRLPHRCEPVICRFVHESVASHTPGNRSTA